VEGGEGLGGGALPDAGGAGEDQAVGEAVGGEGAAEPGERFVLVEDGREGGEHFGKR
jgi:hypothetical protein